MFDRSSKTEYEPGYYTIKVGDVVIGTGAGGMREFDEYMVHEEEKEAINKWANDLTNDRERIENAYWYGLEQEEEEYMKKRKP